MPKITPSLWFDTQAEEAARFYTSIFKNSSIGSILRYGEGSRMPEGTVMTINFELDGQPFNAINGGPYFTFSEAVSFIVNCDSQEEVDYYWDKLSEGGDPAAQQCGWLKDKYGLSWQIVPHRLVTLLGDADAAKAQRVTEVMLQMKKIDIAALEAAYEGA